MRRIYRYFRTRSVRFIIITSCAAIVLVLVFGIALAIFTSFKSGINEAVSVQTRELSTQIVYNYENYISSIIETSNTIQTDIDRYNIAARADADAFSTYLAEIVHLKNDILKIAVYDYETSLCLASSNPEELGSRSGDEDETWFHEAVFDPTVHVFSVPYSEGDSGRYKVNISKQIKLQSDGAQGVLKIEISFQNFIDLVEKSNLGENGHIAIIDPGYNIVYNSLSEGDETADTEVIREIVLGSKNVVVDGYNMTVNVDTLSNTKWRICVFINIDRIGHIQQGFLVTVVLVSLAVLVAGILLFLFAAQMITSPMKQLELAMRKVEKSDYFHMEEVNLVASKEVQALTRRFNKMMRKISELMERVIAEQNAQRKSELKALQNQINPHFLYNTLDSIVWLVENGKNKEAGEMVVALARLFRISISKDREIIPVRDELEHIRNYLLIQNIRYVDSFDYTFDVDEQALDCMTIKLVLQPLVENCIYHGLKNKIDKGIIRITARREEDTLVFTVADNGYGMRRQTIDKLYHSFEDGVVSDSVGLKNIYQRIKIYSGGKAEMLIESELDEGTIITIREPLIRE